MNIRTIIYTLLLLLVPVCGMGRDGSAREELRKVVGVYEAERYPEALDGFISLMQRAEREHDDRTYVQCTGYIGNIYDAFGDYNSCAAYYEKGYNTARKAGDSNMQSNFLTNLVTVYCRIGDIQKAKYYYNLSLSTPNDKDPTERQYYLYYNKARILQAEHKYDEAVRIHRQALEYAKANNMKPLYNLFQLSEIGNIYVLMGRNNDAVAMGDTCMRLSKQLGSGELLTNAYKMLADGYEHDAQPDSARKYRALFFALNDSVYNTKKFYNARHKLDEYEGRLNMEHISSLNERISNQAHIIIAAAIILIILIGASVIIVRKNRRLQQAQMLLIGKNKELETQAEENQSLLAMYLEELERASLRSGKDTPIEHKPVANCTKDNTQSVSRQSSALLGDTEKKELLSKINSVMSDESAISNPDFSLQMLANNIGSNIRYVSWVINDSYHKTFKTLLNELRIRNACHKLADRESYGRFTMQAVYEAVGYTNAASFNRAFKKVYGMTPTEYQRLATQESSFD